MGADIGYISMPMFSWFNQVFSFQRPVYRRERSKEFSGFVPVNKDMAYRFADKLRCPCSGFNRFAFMLEHFIPCGPGFNRLRICPPAQFPGGNSEYPAGAFLGKALHNSVVYNINH